MHCLFLRLNNFGSVAHCESLHVLMILGDHDLLYDPNNVARPHEELYHCQVIFYLALLAFSLLSHLRLCFRKERCNANLLVHLSAPLQSPLRFDCSRGIRVKVVDTVVVAVFQP